MDHCTVCGTPLPEDSCELCTAPVCPEHVAEHVRESHPDAD